MRLAALLLSLLALAGCGRPNEVVVLDGWWSADFARSMCESVKQSPEAFSTSNFDACVLDPTPDVRRFEIDLATQFAANSECSSIEFVSFTDPRQANRKASEAVGKQHWSLSLNYLPGATKQPWSMIHAPEMSTFTQGEGDPEAIAKKVCSIVKGRGAKLLN
jgi:hypothetical protein